jgi:plasmid stabilization system protein ParE
MNERKKFRLIISPDAEKEVKISFEFYEERKAGLGKDFVSEVNLTIERIVANPEQFIKLRNRQVRKAKVSRFPFGIYFAEKDLIISVLAVYHSSRNPRNLRKRKIV